MIVLYYLVIEYFLCAGLLRGYYNYYFTSCEFFTPELADGLSLESEWQQVSSGLQGVAQYSSKSQQCCSLDGLDSSLFKISYSPPLQALRNITSTPITTGITIILIFSQFSKFPGKVQVLVSLFAFFDFHFVVCRDGKVH